MLLKIRREQVTPPHRRALRMIVMILLLFGAGSSANLAALETINDSYPSPAPFYNPMAVAIHQVFFRDRNLDVKVIVTRAEVDRAALCGGDVDVMLRIGSTILCATRGLPARRFFLTTRKPFWSLAVRQEINSVAEIKVIGSGGGVVGSSRYGTSKVILGNHGLDPDKNGIVDNAGFKLLVDDQLAGIGPKDTPLSELFEFNLLQQVLKQGR